MALREPKWQKHRLDIGWLHSMAKMPIYRHVNHENWYVARAVKSYYGDSYDVLELKTDEQISSRSRMAPKRLRKWFEPITDKHEYQEALALITAIYFL